MLLPPFRLYGLLGCPHCADAEKFFREKNVPAMLIVANDDPVADAGIRAITKKPDANYPILVCTFSKQIIEGFKQDEYERLTAAYSVLFGTSASGTSNSGQQPNGETPSQTAETAAGVN